MSKWTSCHAQLNEAGNFLTEMTEPSVSLSLVKHLSKVNMQWAERMKKTVFVSVHAHFQLSIYLFYLKNCNTKYECSPMFRAQTHNFFNS